MIFAPTPVAGAWLLRLERRADDRGWFARTFCVDELAAHGLHTDFPQGNLSYNEHRGTLRGLHWQDPPHGEVKIVECTRGRVWDVILDLRPGSPTRGAHYGVELDAGERQQLYVPEGVAHGFLTLEDGCEVAYRMGARYAPGAGRGVRWDDPAFGIAWPGPVRVIAERDASWPDWEDQQAGGGEEAP